MYHKNDKATEQKHSGLIDVILFLLKLYHRLHKAYSSYIIIIYFHTHRVYCKKPAAVYLRPQVPQPEGLPPCPVTAESDSPTPAHNYRPLQIDVVAVDDQGRQFDNISSLKYDWHVSDKSLGELDSDGDIKHKTSKQQDGASKFTCKWWSA